MRRQDRGGRKLSSTLNFILIIALNFIAIKRAAMQKNEMQDIVDKLAKQRKSHFQNIEKLTLGDIKELVRQQSMSQRFSNGSR